MLLGPSVVAAVLLIDLIGARSNALFLVAHSSTPIEPFSRDGLPWTGSLD
jgi:hypothetical protein